MKHTHIPHIIKAERNITSNTTIGRMPKSQSQRNAASNNGMSFAAIREQFHCPMHFRPTRIIQIGKGRGRIKKIQFYQIKVPLFKDCFKSFAYILLNRLTVNIQAVKAAPVSAGLP